MMGEESFSRRVSIKLSPISPGFTPSTDIKHTVTPEHEEKEKYRDHLSVFKFREK